MARKATASTPTTGKNKDGSNDSILVAGVSLERPAERPARRKPHKYEGKKTRLELYPFLFAIFAANEELAVAGKRPLTNPQIEDTVRAEFEEYPVLVGKIGTAEYSVGKWRAYFNSGRLMVRNGQRFKPSMASFRYNESGKPVESRYGNRLLTPREQYQVAKANNLSDPRMPGWLESETASESVEKRRRSRINNRDNTDIFKK